MKLHLILKIRIYILKLVMYDLVSKIIFKIDRDESGEEV